MKTPPPPPKPPAAVATALSVLDKSAPDGRGAAGPPPPPADNEAPGPQGGYVFCSKGYRMDAKNVGGGASPPLTHPPPPHDWLDVGEPWTPCLRHERRPTAAARPARRRRQRAGLRCRRIACCARAARDEERNRARQAPNARHEGDKGAARAAQAAIWVSTRV